ncbi:Transposase, IS5 family [Halanaeroarchaeum sp. HSR-CO]|nr:Transposase, IS5 family [Halanaeroarchaeum sp. HSR-CO]
MNSCSLSAKKASDRIKHREFSPLDATHSARIDDVTYHRRSVVESSNRIICHQNKEMSSRSLSMYVSYFPSYSSDCSVSGDLSSS